MTGVLKPVFGQRHFLPPAQATAGTPPASPSATPSNDTTPATAPIPPPRLVSLSPLASRALASRAASPARSSSWSTATVTVMTRAPCPASTRAHPTASSAPPASAEIGRAHV